MSSRAHLVIIASLAGCAPEETRPAEINPVETAPAPTLRVRTLPSPAGDTCVYPRLCRGGDGKVYLSWTRRLEGKRHELQFARFERGAFSDSKTVASGDNWFVNWADFPSVTASRNGTLAAHWLQRNGEGTYSYGIRIACSTDDGATWPKQFWLHEDRQAAEHGFATLVPDGDRFQAVWLDGRDMKRTRHMTLRANTFDAGGPDFGEALLDPMVCECCATDAAMVGSKLFTVYRDRLESNVRDIAVVRGVGDAWSAPRAVHDDDWSTPG